MAIRVTSSEELQLASTRCALHRLLRICKAYDVVVDIWVSIPCTAGTPFRRLNEKRGAETHDLQVGSCGRRFVSTRCAKWWFQLGMDQ